MARQPTHSIEGLEYQDLLDAEPPLLANRRSAHSFASQLRMVPSHLLNQNPHSNQSQSSSATDLRDTMNNTTTQSASIDSNGNVPISWRVPTDNIAPGAEGHTPYVYYDVQDTAASVFDPVDPNIDRNTVFLNLKEVTAWRKQQKTDDYVDPTIPVTDAQKRAYVKVLFKAFKSVLGARDNDAMKAPFISQKHNNINVEAMCWTLLEHTIHRSMFGSLLKTFDESKIKAGSNHYSFAERFDEMIQSMKLEKTICKHLLDPPYGHTFIDDPKHARDRVKSNRDLNKRKGAVMAAGHEVRGDVSRRVTRRKVKTEQITPPRHTSGTSAYLQSPAHGLPSTPQRLRGSQHGRHLSDETVESGYIYSTPHSAGSPFSNLPPSSLASYTNSPMGSGVNIPVNNSPLGRRAPGSMFRGGFEPPPPSQSSSYDSGSYGYHFHVAPPSTPASFTPSQIQSATYTLHGASRVLGDAMLVQGDEVSSYNTSLESRLLAIHAVRRRDDTVDDLDDLDDGDDDRLMQGTAEGMNEYRIDPNLPE